MRAIVIAFLILVSTCTGCAATSKCAEPAHRNDLLCAVQAGVVDCTSESAKVLVGQFAGVLEQLIAKSTGADGKVDWPGLLPALQQLGIADGGCVLATVVNKLQGRAAAESGPGRPSHESVAHGFDWVRSQLYPGIRFRLGPTELQ